MTTNGTDRAGYSLVAKSLHWLIAVLILGLIWLGWYMVGLSYYDRWQNLAIATHRSLGMLVLALAIIKIGVVVVSKSPGFVDSIRPWERVAATATHLALYLAMVLIPVTGYIISTSSGDPIPMFGWFQIPVTFEVSTNMRDWAIDIHFYAAYIALGMAGMHAAAALKHHFIDKDDTLRNML